MSKLFGIPVGSLALVLVALLVLSLAGVAAVAVRNRVFVRLGLRSAQRRRGRSALIVAGLMLGTVIISAALATGDTMSQTIRSTALGALGNADEVVGAKGISSAFATASGGTGARYFPQSHTRKIVRAGGDRVTFVYPVLVDSVAVVDLHSRQSEPRVTLYASTPVGLPVAGLRPGQVVLNPKAADKLDAKPGDTLRVLAGARTTTVRVKEVRHYSGGAAAASGLLISLPSAQRLFAKPGMVNGFMVGNRDGLAGTDAVIAALNPTLDRLGLEADNTREDFIKVADKEGAAFMSLFSTFGSFSIAAGVLLIFLIFVMLAAERRNELGIARAVGTRRSHLVWMFVFEGLAYDLAAAAIGVLVGIGVAYLMVLALSGLLAASDISIGFTVKPASIALAYSIGVLLTLLVVAYSARRVSRMNIVSAIRGLPEPAATKVGKRRWLWPAVGILLGLLFVWAGVQAEGRRLPRRRRLRSRAQRRPAPLARGRPRPAATHGGRARARLLVHAADPAPAPGPTEDQFRPLRLRRPDDRDRRHLGDRLQRRPPARRAQRNPGPDPVARTRTADGGRLSAEEPLPHRRHPRDVHARRLHPRGRLHDHRLDGQRLQRRQCLRRRLRHPGRRLPLDTDPQHPPGAATRAVASTHPTSVPSLRCPPCPSKHGRSASA